VVNLPRASVQTPSRCLLSFQLATMEVVVEFTAAFVEVMDEVSWLRTGCAAIRCEGDDQKQQNGHLAQEASWAGPHTGNVDGDNPSWREAVPL